MYARLSNIHAMNVSIIKSRVSFVLIDFCVLTMCHDFTCMITRIYICVEITRLVNLQIE